MAAPDTERAYIGLGANLGDPQSTLSAALAALGRTAGVRLAARSSLYRSTQLGYAEQPDFFNAVAAVDTPPLPRRPQGDRHRTKLVKISAGAAHDRQHRDGRYHQQTSLKRIGRKLDDQRRRLFV
jgi:hypothetical protein